MTAEPGSYFERRAEAELELAEQAVHPAAVRAHYLLAGYYLDQVYGGADDQPPALAAQPAYESPPVGQGDKALILSRPSQTGWSTGAEPGPLAGSRSE